MSEGARRLEGGRNDRVSISGRGACSFFDDSRDRRASTRGGGDVLDRELHRAEELGRAPSGRSQDGGDSPYLSGAMRPSASRETNPPLVAGGAPTNQTSSFKGDRGEPEPLASAWPTMVADPLNGKAGSHPLIDRQSRMGWAGDPNRFLGRKPFDE